MMNKLTSVLLVGLVAAGLVPAKIAQAAKAPAKKEKYVLVRTYDYTKTMSYEVITDTDYKTRLARIKLESRYWTKALQAAEKEYKKKPENARKRFPRGCVVPKKITMSGRPYTVQEDAIKKLEKYEEKLALDEKEDKAKKRNRQNRSLDQRMQGTQETMRRKLMAKHKADVAEEEAEEEAKEAVLNDARNLFSTKLNELISAAAAPAR